MASWVRSLVVIVFIGYCIELYLRGAPRPVHVDGECHPHFQKVRDAFRLNLELGWERGGGAFVVYHKGKKVVDIWGGYADKSADRLWKKDTMNVAFSSTKAVAALCVAHLVEAGRVAYDDLVVKHWKEFGQNGKENITVRWVMNHQSALAYTDEPIDYETGTNHTAIAKVFEKQRPNWPAGHSIGYHAITYGWLVDQIIRRTDEKGRGVGQYFREEIAQKHDIDFHIGLRHSLVHRVSRLKAPTVWNFIDEYIHSPSDFNLRRLFSQIVFGGPLSLVSSNVPWISFVREMTLNNPELFSVEQAAVLGIGTARALAELFEKLRSGSLLSPSTVRLLTSEFVRTEDVVTGANVARGQGFMIKEFTHNLTSHKLLGHSGFGGQNVRIDFENELTFAYMSNHLKVGFGDTARTYIQLLHALYDSIESINSQ